MSEKIKINFIKNKYKILVFCILIVGFLTRIVSIDMHPNGLNVDEASIGYEAYSILNYGIDRNGKSFPVFLEAWGSGQNALYAYIIMPFVNVLGLSTLSIRLPMAIIGCISLIVLYKILSKIKVEEETKEPTSIKKNKISNIFTNNEKLVLVVLAFFAINPWHIMKSRFGLESNVFPDIMLWSVYFLVTFLKEGKISNFYIASCLLGLCSYSYGTSYLFLPIFVMMLLIVLIKTRKIKICNAIIFISIIFLISLPILLMILINSFDLNELKIGMITIPRMQSNRYETLTVLSSDNILKTLLNNFIECMKIIIFQTDELISNAIKPYGIIYIFSLPLTIVGMIKCFKRKNEINTIINIWFLSSILLTFFVEPNINRINILWIPIIYYTAIGIYEIVVNNKILKWVIIFIYLVFFIKFEYSYFRTDFTKNYTFYDKIENIIKYTESIDADTIYFQYAFKEPYIYVLFYNKCNPKDFALTVKYKNDIKGFDSVISFGKYKFYLPKEIQDDKNFVYVMKAGEEQKYKINENIWKKTYIDDFLILEKSK